MGRLIDKDELIKYVYDTYGIGSVQATNKECFDIICHIYEAPTVEAIPKEEARQFIESIQKIKDNHNEHGEPINYGTICGILIEGYRLLDKYKKGKDGNDD